MIGDGACGVNAAYTGTRINTVLVDACFVPRTLRIDCTLRLALNIRIANVVPDTGTRGGIAALRAHGVYAARRRVAWLDNFNGTCS